MIEPGPVVHDITVDELRSEVRPEVYLASPRCSCGWTGRWFMPEAAGTTGSVTESVRAAAESQGRRHLTSYAAPG